MSRWDSATPLGNVRGTGSAKEGGEHWVRERLVSIAMLLLGLWLVASLLMLPDLGRRTLTEFLSAPSGAIPMALFIIASFVHAIDGMKVVIDDYVHDHANHFLISAFVWLVGIGAASLALFSLAQIAFGAS